MPTPDTVIANLKVVHIEQNREIVGLPRNAHPGDRNYTALAIGFTTCRAFVKGPDDKMYVIMIPLELSEVILHPSAQPENENPPRFEREPPV